MKNFRRGLFFVFFIVLGSIVFAQNKSVKNADIVILVDTSGGILQYYEEINNTVLTEITNKFVRNGDTVHVLSFNSTVQYEMSQKIKSEKDLSRIVSRFLLMYQLGQNSDFLSGLDYCKKYTAKLPPKDEQILIVISDGIFNPPNSSPYKNYSDKQVKNQISYLAGNIRKTGWKVYYVKLPYPSDAIIRNLDGEEFYTGRADDSKTVGSQNKNSNQGGDSSGSGTDGKGDNNQDNDGGNDYQGSGDNGGTGDESSGSDNGDSSGNNNDDASGTGSDYTGGNSGSGDGDDSTGDNSDSATGDETESYTDVSEDFTESAGAAKTELSKNKDDKFEINDKIKDYPIVTFPDRLEAEGNKLKFSLLVSNNTDEAVELKLDNISLDNGNSLSEIPVETKRILVNPGEELEIPVNAILPEEYTEGNYNTLLSLHFEDDKKVFPQATELGLSVFPSLGQRIFDSNLLYIIIGLLILLLLLILIIFLIRRRSSNTASNAVRRSGMRSTEHQEDKNGQPKKLQEEDDHAARLRAFNSGVAEKNTTQASAFKSSKTAFAAGAGGSIYSSSTTDRIANQKQDDDAMRDKVLKGSLSSQQPRGTYMSPANHLEKIEIKANKSGMSEIYVLNQNRNIGKRNIHVMKPGARLSVGGGKTDDFLIFLVPFPAKLAQVRYDGEDYHLAILKPEYFPYEKANVVNNCVGKTVTAVSDKGYHVYFTFRGYEDPATKLNTLLTSISYE